MKKDNIEPKQSIFRRGDRARIQREYQFQRIQEMLRAAQLRAEMTQAENDPNVIVEGNWTIIGPNGTKIAKAVYRALNWERPSVVVRVLLVLIFGRDTLRTHSLTGMASGKFLDTVKKLDAQKVADIVDLVTKKTSLSEEEIREIIATKCKNEKRLFILRMMARRQPE